MRGYMPETRAPLLTLVAVDLSCPAPEFDETESNIYEVVPPDSFVSETIPPVSEMGAPASETGAPVSEAERRLPLPSPEPTPPSAADSPTSPYPPVGSLLNLTITISSSPFNECLRGRSVWCAAVASLAGAAGQGPMGGPTEGHLLTTLTRGGTLAHTGKDEVRHSNLSVVRCERRRGDSNL